MAAEPKVVRGTFGGVSVQATEETAALLDGFEPESKTTTRKSAASSSKSEK